jgi:hypothetical protein
MSVVQIFAFLEFGQIVSFPQGTMAYRIGLQGFLKNIGGCKSFYDIIIDGSVKF